MEPESRYDSTRSILPQMSQDISSASLELEQSFEDQSKWRCELSKLTWTWRKILAITAIVLVFVAIAIIFYFATLEYEWINVHLVPHSHDDVGWIRTPEEYYSFNVKHILDHVVTELQKNPKRKFVYVETYFFWKWWQEKSYNMQLVVRKLIEDGQLEITGGGWCMNDEAVTHYQSIIDQFTYGFRKLNDTFGAATWPTIGWQIDTFGHSREQASLMAQLGFNAVFFARIDMDDREYRKKYQLMEFIWEGSNNLGAPVNLFTSIMYDHYNPPKGFDFEMEPSDDEVDLHNFADQVRQQAAAYRTNNILIPMGDDFRYYNARLYFEKMDTLITLAERNPRYKLKIFYSTPSLYIRSVHNNNITWINKQGDFFPYASERHEYWTGYYTSRPTLKYFERISNNFLQICKQVLVFSDLGRRFSDNLNKLREAVSTMQHHDAITGTSTQAVTDHYSEMLAEGINSCSQAIDFSLKKLMTNITPSNELQYKSCLRLNISECDVTEHSTSFIVTLYNPLNHISNRYVRLPITKKNYVVRDGHGRHLTTQLVEIPASVRRLLGRNSSATTELVFHATNIPALGFISYYVSAVDRSEEDTTEPTEKKLTVKFDEKTKLISEISTDLDTFPLEQSIRYYKGSHHWTGAYIFRPGEDETFPPSESVVTKSINDGALVTEYEQTFSEWASQIVRTYKDEEYVEIEWLVGPVPVSDFIGKEVIMFYSTKIFNDKTFYTDLNGREIEERIRGYRDWKGEVYEPVAGNYYPVTSQISIKDRKRQVFIVNDRAQGGSSIRNGDIELMVHRRLCYDDEKGVNEALNETAYGFGLVARGKHWVITGKANDKDLPQKVKLFAQARHSEQWLFLSDASKLSFEKWLTYVNEFSGLTLEMPPNVRILTLEPWRDNEILLRLEHIFEKDPDTNLSKPVVVSLKSLFSNFEVLEARETTLGADRWRSDSKRLHWRQADRNAPPGREEGNLDANMVITLSPMEIRTFIVQIRPSIQRL